jgi:RND family efflux transporter MFP subunit
MNRSKQPSTSVFKKVPNSVTVLLILLAAFAIAYAVIKTAPKPERKETVVKERLVEVLELKRVDSRPTWLAGGEVKASQQVALSSEVNGRVVSLHSQAVPGAFLAKGAKLAQLDPQDFQLALTQAQAAVTQAKADLDIELGQGRSAALDYKNSLESRSTSRSQTTRSSSEQDKALMLREPQKQAKQAALARAQAELNQAKLNLKRTAITMPFDGQILSRQVSMGSQVSTNNPLFEIASSEEYWLEVKISKQLLSFLDQDAAVMVGQKNWPLIDGQSSWHKAKLLHVLPQVDVVDRQSKLLIAINNPLALTPNILIGDYLDVRLAAKEFINSYKISSQYFVDEDSVWVVNDNKLYKRKLNILFKGREYVWAESGFENGDRLLISKLGTITEGTPVRFKAEVQ